MTTIAWGIALEIELLELERSLISILRVDPERRYSLRRGSCEGQGDLLLSSVCHQMKEKLRQNKIFNGTKKN